jgi:hypothetical protein
MVIGGQAVLLYGEPRLTRDIDITLGMDADGLNRLMDMLPAVPLKVLVENVREFVTRTMVLPALEERSGIRVDFIFSFSPYERQAIGRAVDVKISRSSVKFGSLEDIVIHKIIAGRPRDLEDIRSILLKNPQYDSGYIERWLKEFEDSLGQSFLTVFRCVLQEIE